jgi:hypothetical protein
MNAFRAAIFICVLALTPLGAIASHVLVRAEGTVQTIFDYDGLLPFSLIGGELMSISYLIDDAATPVDEYPSLPNNARYQGAVLSMTVTIGEHSVVIVPPESGASYMAVLNDSPVGNRLADSWAVGAQTHLSPPAAPERMYSGSVYLYMEMLDSSPAPALVSDESFQPVPPQDWQEAMEFANGPLGAASIYFSVFSGAMSSSVGAPISTLTVTPVPIPAAAWLLLSGFGAFLSAVRPGGAR